MQCSDRCRRDFVNVCFRAVCRSEPRISRRIYGSRPNIRNIIGRCRASIMASMRLADTVAAIPDNSRNPQPRVAINRHPRPRPLPFEKCPNSRRARRKKNLAKNQIAACQSPRAQAKATPRQKAKTGRALPSRATLRTGGPCEPVVVLTAANCRSLYDGRDQKLRGSRPGRGQASCVWSDRTTVSAIGAVRLTTRPQAIVGDAWPDRTTDRSKWLESPSSADRRPRPRFSCRSRTNDGVASSAPTDQCRRR
jgi:hypothetical protein